MESCAAKAFCSNFKQILLDEIALNGLEGVGTEQLWRYYEKRTSSSFTEKMKERFWSFLVNCEGLTFYELPEPIEPLDIVDRFTIINEESGHLDDPIECPDGPYEYHPIPNAYGSCKHYETRKEISKNELQVLYKDIMSRYGHKLVIVASLELRWQALAPHMPITIMKELTMIQYCILELIGKGRENGQMTLGNTNLSKILKDSKLLFYNRNHLYKMDLICVQHTTQLVSNKAIKVLLLQLKRFYQPKILTAPKRGVLHDLMVHLSEQPNQCDRTDMIIKKGIVSGNRLKKLRKTHNMFKFIEKPYLEEHKSKKPRKQPPTRKYVMLETSSDESSQSEGEIEEPRKCQYKVGVNLYRQAYERFIDAGLNGLTQIELAQLLGVEFYTTRTICRIFKTKKIVREFLEDRGRQRTAKYIAVHATQEMDVKYEAEKTKFLKYLDESKNLENTMDESFALTESGVETDSEIPKKKIKLEEAHKSAHEIVIDAHDPDPETLAKHVIEIKVLNGLENSNATSLFGSKRTPTLRQLRFANALLKVIREKHVVQGYQKASFLASREVGEPPMDTKGLKLIIQKLINDGQIKVYKINFGNMSPQIRLLICAPHVKPADSIIRSKFREVKMRAIVKDTQVPAKPVSETTNKFLSLYVYPRYMKIQKVHECLYDLVYSGDEDTNQFGYEKGFSSLIHIMPELTLAFAVGNLTQGTLSELSNIKITKDMMDMKLKHVPKDLFAIFLASKSFRQCFRCNMKILAMLGLVQLIRNPTQSEDNKLYNNMFYVNRNAKIIDTTGTWPRTTANIEDLTKSYRFNTFEDVENYWHDVYNISIKTKIVAEQSARKRKRLLPPLRTKEEVLENDTRQIFGDGQGPCGFDASLYMEQARSWTTFYSNIRKKPIPSRLKALVIPKKEKRKVTKSTVPKVTKKIVPKPVVIVPKTKKRLKNNAFPKWTKEEDKVLMICKVAVTILSPMSQPGCLRLRNLIAKEILITKDPKKIATICHKRFVMLESDTSQSYQKDCILNELRHRRHLIQKYDGLFKTLKLRFARNMTKFLSEARIPMLELVYLILQLIKSKSFNQKLPCVAMNVEEFHAKFAISATSADKPYNLYRTPRDEPVMSALKEGIIMTVMMSYKREHSVDIAQKILSMFNKFSEQTLRFAIEQLRKSGTVSAKEKLLNNQIHRHHMQDILQESFKISAMYQRKWICRLNAEFVDKLMDSVYLPLPQKGVKGCPEMNCLLFELKACNVLDIVSENIPAVTGAAGSLLPEDLTGEHSIKLNLNSGSCRWINKTNVKILSELYEDMEVQEHLAALRRNSTVALCENEADYNEEDKIVSYLETKKEVGATFPELQDHTSYDPETLTKKLQQLETSQIVKRVGYFENLTVLMKYAKYWTLTIDDGHVIPVPYLTLNKEVRKDILLKWAGVILNKVFENPGCSIWYIADSCDLVSTRTAQEICMFLEKCKCVTLHVMKATKPNLFSEDDELPELLEFNLYESVENIVVFPVRDSFTRFATLKQKIIDLEMPC